MNENIIFRDGLEKVYKMVWDGVDSILYARLRGGNWLHLRVVQPQEVDVFMGHEISAEEYVEYETTVEPLGRNFFMVKSSSRPDVAHVVDLESNVYSQSPACSCEQNRFRKCECSHLRAVAQFLLTCDSSYLGASPLLPMQLGIAA